MLIPSPDVVFGPFGLTDQIGGTLVVPYVDEAGTIVDLDGFSVGAARAYTPEGLAVDIPALIVETIDGIHVVEYDFPATSWTDQTPGVWALAAGLAHDWEPVTEWTVPLGFVVEDRLSGWLTIAATREQWRDAPSNDVVLWRLLDVARRQVDGWAIHVDAADPTIVVPPTSNLVVAQGMQARNVWNASKTDPASLGIGEGDFVIRPYPLDPVIKDIIRPKSPKPVIA